MSGIQVGDVVFCEGASAILGDVVGVEEESEFGRFLQVAWRPAHSVEDEEDLELAEDQTPPEEATTRLTPKLIESGNPSLGTDGTCEL